MTNQPDRLAVLTLLLLLTSCGRHAPTADPEYLTVNPPSVATECNSQPCYCDSLTQFSGYQRSQYTLHSGDYMGDGTHQVVMIFDADTLVYHIVPDGPCGRLQAANAQCALCVEGRTQEPELLAHTYSGAVAGPVVKLFRGRAGKAYLFYWHAPFGVVHIAPILAGVDTVRII